MNSESTKSCRFKLSLLIMGTDQMVLTTVDIKKSQVQYYFTKIAMIANCKRMMSITFSNDTYM